MKEKDVRFGAVSFGPGKRQVAGCYEHDRMRAVATKCGNFWTE
jgi:hypothetical protein